MNDVINLLLTLAIPELEVRCGLLQINQTLASVNHVLFLWDEAVGWCSARRVSRDCVWSVVREGQGLIRAIDLHDSNAQRTGF